MSRRGTKRRTTISIVGPRRRKRNPGAADSIVPIALLGGAGFLVFTGLKPGGWLDAIVNPGTTTSPLLASPGASAGLAPGNTPVQAIPAAVVGSSAGSQITPAPPVTTVAVATVTPKPVTVAPTPLPPIQTSPPTITVDPYATQRANLAAYLFQMGVPAALVEAATQNYDFAAGAYQADFLDKLYRSAASGDIGWMALADAGPVLMNYWEWNYYRGFNQDPVANMSTKVSASQYVRDVNAYLSSAGMTGLAGYPPSWVTWIPNAPNTYDYTYFSKLQSQRFQEMISHGGNAVQAQFYESGGWVQDFADCGGLTASALDACHAAPHWVFRPEAVWAMIEGAGDTSVFFGPPPTSVQTQYSGPAPLPAVMPVPVPYSSAGVPTPGQTPQPGEVPMSTPQTVAQQMSGQVAGSSLVTVSSPGGDLIPGIPNMYLALGAGALVLIPVLMKAGHR